MYGDPTGPRVNVENIFKAQKGAGTVPTIIMGDFNTYMEKVYEEMNNNPRNVYEMNYNDIGYTRFSEQGYRAILDIIITNCEIEESQINKYGETQIIPQ